MTHKEATINLIFVSALYATTFVAALVAGNIMADKVVDAVETWYTTR